MLSSKKTLVLLLVAIIGALILAAPLFVHTYISSPGYTTEEMAQDFYSNQPKCYGVNFLMNEEETYADAPGISKCIGVLVR